MEEKIELTVIILASRSKDVRKLNKLITCGMMQSPYLMAAVEPTTIVLVDEMRSALEDGGDAIAELLRQDTKKRLLLAADAKAEELLQEMEPVLEEQGLRDEGLMICWKSRALQAYCDRREWKRIPESMDQDHVFATEAVRMIYGYLRQQMNVYVAARQATAERIRRQRSVR